MKSVKEVQDVFDAYVRNIQKLRRNCTQAIDDFAAKLISYNDLEDKNFAELEEVTAFNKSVSFYRSIGYKVKISFNDCYLPTKVTVSI